MSTTATPDRFTTLPDEHALRRTPDQVGQVNEQRDGCTEQIELPGPKRAERYLAEQPLDGPNDKRQQR